MIVRHLEFDMNDTEMEDTEMDNFEEERQLFPQFPTQSKPMSSVF